MDILAQWWQQTPMHDTNLLLDYHIHVNKSFSVDRCNVLLQTGTIIRLYLFFCYTAEVERYLQITKNWLRSWLYNPNHSWCSHQGDTVYEQMSYVYCSCIAKQSEVSSRFQYRTATDSIILYIHIHTRNVFNDKNNHIEWLKTTAMFKRTIRLWSALEDIFRCQLRPGYKPNVNVCGCMYV